MGIHDWGPRAIVNKLRIIAQEKNVRLGKHVLASLAFRLSLRTLRGPGSGGRCLCPGPLAALHDRGGAQPRGGARILAITEFTRRLSRPDTALFGAV